MRKSGLLLGAALALTATTASGAENINTANVMLPACKNYLDPRSRDDIELQSYCLGVVRGISRALVGALPSLDDDIRRNMCLNIPAEAAVTQGVRVVVAYIEARPSRMHESFYVLVLEALRTAWPCR
jgi:hypothetical protein